MKKQIIVAAVLASFFSAFAYETNGILSSGTQLKKNNSDDDPILKQIETFTGSIKIPFNNEGSVYFAAEGSVQHKYDCDFNAKDNAENSVILDATLFKIDSFIKLSNASTIQVTAGRFFVSDATGLILSQPEDGLMFKYINPAVETGLYAGYSGLQNLKNVSILDSKGVNITKDKEQDLYDFSAPYGVFSGSVSFPYAVLNQTISVEALGMVQTEGPSEMYDDDARLYATLALNGPLSTSVFYSVSGTMGTTDFDEFYNLDKLDINWFAPVLNSSLSLSAVYASGKSGELSTFTKGTACLSKEEPGYSGLFKAGISGTIVPSSVLFCAAGADCVFKDTDGFEYYGIQASASARFQIFSDLEFAVSYTGFFADDSDQSKNELGFNLTLAF